MIGPLVFFLLLLAAVILLVQAVFNERRPDPSRTNANDVLDERYAKGEIDREEYLRRRQDIKGA